MKILHHTFFLFVAIFLILQILLHLNVNLPNWVVFYVNDFLCMPIVLTICLKAVHLIWKDPTIRLPLFTILSLTTFYAIYFEVYLPKVEPRYTGDVWDVVMYVLGSLLFYFLQFRE
ncbi:MAG TPA: hypothetical protein VK941_03725 [Gillisia sp.]|nr:hypothetical protein [Gillisia sp.]